MKEFLDTKLEQFNTPAFLETDPVSIPHLFTTKEDIEISAFLTATIAWGGRKSIISSAGKLMGMMDMAPFDFIKNAGPRDYQPFRKFVHRTFNGSDCVAFLRSLQHIYLYEGGLEKGFDLRQGTGMKDRIAGFRRQFLGFPHPPRTEKHIADPLKGASCKRINMFLRWMVRKDGKGVDFGLWKSISPGELVCPLDLHSGRVARKLGLLHRKSNDWKAAEELTNALRELDREDPVKYDLALFGLGVFENF